MKFKIIVLIAIVMFGAQNAFADERLKEIERLMASQSAKNVEPLKDGVIKAYFHKTNKVSEEITYNKGVKDKAVYYFENGQKSSELNFKNGLSEGVETIYWVNGKIKSSRVHKNGKLNGTAKVFNENGKLKSEIGFKDDIIDGYLRVYDSDGVLLDEKLFDNGIEKEIVKPKVITPLDESSEIKESVTASDDQLNAN